ncbi:MAG: serine hydrolase, partial [Asgard group archaeon]|nr:serine hydrolase [Asgard group archaeon]
TPGITLSVVNATDILYLKGYGYANIEESLPVNPNTTMFRAASVSKLFIWTAVMQLVEQGLLDLNTDVNEYLSAFKIPDKFDAPITLSHLMGHSAGFEVLTHKTFEINEVDSLFFEEYLINNMPKRAFPPGEISSYSNYGSALAAYIVSQVSNKSFDEYVKDNIFTPLGMTHSTFKQPVPSEFEDDLATCYSFSENGSLQADPFNFIALYPAGSLSISALDAAYFMIAHLNNGSLGSNSILEEETAKQMHLQHFTHYPTFDGFAHGFMEMTINGHRFIWHGGDLNDAHSALLLLLDQNIGFFFNYNIGGNLRTFVINEFMNHFYPTSPPSILTPSADFKELGKKYKGNYYASQSPFSTPDKIRNILQTYRVDISDEGYLLFGNRKFVEIDDHVFREQNGTARIAFRENNKGKIIYMFLSDVPIVAFIKQLGVERTAVAWVFAFTCIALLLYTLIELFVSWIIRKRYHQEKPQRSKNEKLARKFLITTSSGYVLFIGIFGAALGTLLISNKALPFLEVLQFIPFLLLIPLGLLIFYTILLWKNKQGRLIFRINATLAIITIGFLLWWMSIWNWLGFHFY